MLYSERIDSYHATSSQALPIEAFLQKSLAGMFICSICIQVPHPATAIEHIQCGKVFCYDCLETWAKEKGKIKCPACQGEDLSQGFRPLKDQNKTLYSLMQGLNVRCFNVDPVKGEACEWSGEWCNLENHLKSACLFADIFCRYNCQYHTLRKFIKQHEDNECPNRPIPCTYCNAIVPISTLTDHAKNCEKNPNRVISCPFSYAGCGYSGTLSEVELHKASFKDQHLKLAEIYIEQCNRSLLEKDARIRDLEHKLKNARGSYYFYQCPNKHLLYNVQTHPCCEVFTCNVCGDGMIPFYKGSWRCDSCDWDCCQKCHVLEDNVTLKKCPINSEEHVLVRTMFNIDVNCGMCGKDLAGDVRYWCVYCNYNLCVNCYNNA